MPENNLSVSTEQINTKKMYWVFQITGWTIFYIIYAALAAVMNDNKWYIFIGYLNMVVVGFLITHIYRAYIKKHAWDKLGIFKLSARVLITSLLLGGLWALIVVPINNTFYPPDPEHEFSFVMGFIVVFNLSIVIMAWSMMYFLFKFFLNLKSSEIEKWKLEAAVKDAELIALKSQINPHFIFNCLNNIRSLVVENPEKSRDMIGHLSDLLRYSVQFNNREKVSLKQELEVVQNYLNLESIQFEDRLRYTLEIKPDTLDKQIPPMSVQLLVENAIKHGISNLPEGGVIRINSKLENNTLVVEVFNTGQLNNQKTGTGIGLKNASDRLQLLFGKISNLELSNFDQSMVKACFKIPLS